MLRIANETYGMYSAKFRAYFLVSGCLNFATHYCNNHSSCSSFQWYSRCAGGESIYSPSSPYCVDLLSHRGHRCQKLIPQVFVAIVYGWLCSAYMEGAMWKTIGYPDTTVNESYFGNLAIMIPKCISIKDREYEPKEAAAYLAWQSKRGEFVDLQKRLCAHKYAATLTASNGQKGGIHQSYVLDGLEELFGEDDATKKQVMTCREKVKALIKNRLEMQRLQRQKTMSSTLLSNLHLGPGDGGGTVKRGVQKVEREDCPRPVPPFPFKNDGEMESKEQKLHLDEVYIYIYIWSYTDLIKEIGKEKAYKNRYQRNRLAAISGDNDLSNDSG